MATKKKVTKKAAAKKKVTRKKSASRRQQTEQTAGSYQYDNEAVQRPDVGLQGEFSGVREPKRYRYDSSLDPQLAWDENREREKAEWLLGLIAQAASEGEAKIFDEPQVWQGDETRVESLAGAAKLLQSLSKPFLNWSGKAERHEIRVPTVPLFVHERHSTKAILETIKHRKAIGENLDLFADQQMDIADRLDAYEHKGPWANRMILGDSLQVMNSLLEYEGLGGQVQMIYMDPPYGVKFGSNFQPFVRKRDVKHGADDHMIREPEMVKAYRDTWELGLHSYLTYLRDRLLLARELLTESGSIFVQISDENLHHVRELMDEVFREDNFLSIITFAKAGGGLASASRVAARVDYLLWYAKDAIQSKYNALFERRENPIDEGFELLHLPNGEIRRVTPEERKGATTIDPNAKPFMSVTFTKPGPGSKYEVDLNGKTYDSGKRWWGIPKESLLKVIEQGRTHTTTNEIRFIKYFHDYPYRGLSNLWDKLGGAANPVYVVQTSPEVVKRCILMTTDPGDLVLDPTCGSGTTAYVSEQWGRRWITCDTSRVPLALARQRLLTATFPWYDLKDPNRGPSGGFVYKRKHNRKGEEIGGLVPHITLKSIANDEEPKIEVLVDRPEQVKNITRVTGPFTVEATLPAAMDVEEPKDIPSSQPSSGVRESPHRDAASHLDSMTEVLRQSRTLQLPGNRKLQLDAVHRLTDMEVLHAEAVENNGDTKRIAIVFGPESGAISSHLVLEAAREAYFLKYNHLYLFGFAIQAKARELVENSKKLRIPCTYVAVTPDVVMSDLLKTTRSSEIFSVTGLPVIHIRESGETNATHDKLYITEIQGLDIFDPSTLETESVDAVNLPCWMLDTDYNDLCFYASQVFFPKTSAWSNLKKSLGASYDHSVWDHLAGTISEPFALGNHRRIAVKVIDERGNELMVVREVR